MKTPYLKWKEVMIPFFSGRNVATENSKDFAGCREDDFAQETEKEKPATSGDDGMVMSNS
jgi:hypothetical protein